MQETQTNSGLSLRAKGLIAFGLFALYLAFAAGVVERQRTTLAATVSEIELLHEEEEMLDRVNFSLSQAILSANERYHRPDNSREFVSAVVAAETVQTGVAGMVRQFPELAAVAADIGEKVTLLVVTGERERLLDLREALHRTAAAMDEVTGQIREHKRILAGRYRTQYDAISITWIGLGLVGLFSFGAVLVLFFTRLAWDVRRLQERALAIVKGYRGPPLSVTRSDEIGALMRSVNRMQEELLEHETEVELSRQQYFHREKMAAVGGLAAQIAHEINNPIAAIAGVAEAICATRLAAKCPSHGVACQPELILEQARRVSGITRQIAEFSAPQAAEPQLIDLNTLIENTCAFVRYDKRFRGLHIELDLDRQLPAIHAVGDHLTQVLMNLLINAADAVTEAGAKGRVTVATRLSSGQVVMTVSDNGKGMDEQVKARAFEDFFTTKPHGKGSGIGLGLSRRLLRSAGGEVELDSLPGVGTVVAVRLPQTAQPIAA